MIFNFSRTKKNYQRLHYDICKNITNKRVKREFEHNSWIAEFDEKKGTLLLNHYTVYPFPEISHYQKAIQNLLKKAIIVKTNMYYE